MRFFPVSFFQHTFFLPLFLIPEIFFYPEIEISCFSTASAVLFAHVLGACVCDLRCGRIPNSLILSGILCGAAFRLNGIIALIRSGAPVFSAAACPARALAGFLIPFLFLSLPALLKMIGAGDVKLLAVIGIFAGPGGSLKVLMYSVFAGGAIAAFFVWKRKNLFARMQYFFLYLGRALQTREPAPYRTGEEKSGEFAFSVPILAGLLIYGLRQIIR